MIKIFLRKRSFKWLILIAAVLIGYGGHRIYKEFTMPAPLVFLIPEEYFGPVYFFFGQPDGVDVKSDPLGQAVVVPENGVVKLRAQTQDLLPMHVSDDRRPMYMVSVSKAGQRKILIWNGETTPNDKGEMTDTYLDENSKFHQFPNNNLQDSFYFFTATQKNERMVFNQGSCANQDFFPLNDPNGKPPGCGKFLVVSPNEFIKLPDWMWENLGHSFSSVKKFEDEANEVLIKKKNYYKLR